VLLFTEPHTSADGEGTKQLADPRLLNLRGRDGVRPHDPKSWSTSRTDRLPLFIVQ
jgi:hypothetical protein